MLPRARLTTHNAAADRRGTRADERGHQGAVQTTLLQAWRQVFGLDFVAVESIRGVGFDGSALVFRSGPGGEHNVNPYPARRCRLNTYGDSFTQCHQVSDGETWQEYLAAHLGEPIRNFGVGGYGV